ncbi:hypothetical protein ACFVH0_01575 [Streptomyces sp. NPDC127117]|uniref:hypothetical protein n=1 Tax=Streptomyces sp. NPDC127117 TaxID=3345368 RepID=UPI0036379826
MRQQHGRRAGVRIATAPGTRATFIGPPGYGLPADVLSTARRIAGTAGAVVVETHDVADAPEQMDVVYTTRWQTTGMSKADPAWPETFRPFHVDATLMRRWPEASFLHDLPAHRVTRSRAKCSTARAPWPGPRP